MGLFPSIDPITLAPLCLLKGGGVLMMGDFRDSRPLILILATEGLGGTTGKHSGPEDELLTVPLISRESEIKLLILLFN